jgi:hypothetical protein
MCLATSIHRGDQHQLLQHSNQDQRSKDKPCRNSFHIFGYSHSRCKTLLGLVLHFSLPMHSRQVADSPSLTAHGTHLPCCSHAVAAGHTGDPSALHTAYSTVTK